MRLGYNTNGLAHHDPFAAVELLAELGYQSVALTLDHHLLNPWAANLREQTARMRKLLEQLGMKSVIETGARFLLNPRIKHAPTLVSAAPEDRARRVDFLCRAIDIAAELESDCVSLWSGVLADGAGKDETFGRLTAGLGEVVNHAERRGVIIGFEPEPGMFIDTMAHYEALAARVSADCFRLTLDVGHLHCLGETPIADHIRRWGARLVNVHMEDMRAGVHEHLMFGEGEMDFPPIIAALREIGYSGGVHVELSRHSHEGPTAARRAVEFLHPLFPESM